MKTEKLILFALFFLSVGQLWGQEQKLYKSAAELKGDTLKYLEYNYSAAHSAEYYKGKTVGEILKEIEYPVLYIVEWVRGRDELISLSLGIRQTGKEPSPLEDYYIVVVFSDPPKFSDFRALCDIDVKYRKFTPQVYDFIKDLRVSHVASNPYIIMKRRNLEAKRLKEENMKVEKLKE
jgi:hypothetical protein